MNKINPFFCIDGVHFQDNIDDFCKKLSDKQRFADQKKQLYIQDICALIRLWTDENTALQCLTSGSTGTPKIIQIEKKRMEQSARMTGHFFSLPEKSNVAICLPMSYIAGRMMLIRAMVLGWNVQVIPPCATPWDSLEKTVDFIAVVPLQMYQSISSLSRAKKILVGGGDVSSVFLKKLEKEDIQTHIYQSYAMTETITHVAVRELYPHLDEQYTALEGVTFSCSQNNTLTIHAPLICEKDVETTDVIDFLDQRHFIWKGRADDVINSGGVKIHPAETEKVLSELLECRYFISSVKDERLGEKQVLFIEGEEKDFPQLGAFLTEKFDSIHRPKEMFFLKKFALTHTGKIDRKKTKGFYK